MNQNPSGPNTCDVCHRSFDSEQELQESSTHKQSRSGGEQSNYDIEMDQPNGRKTA
jgi:hypothetical protein